MKIRKLFPTIEDPMFMYDCAASLSGQVAEQGGHEGAVR